MRNLARRELIILVVLVVGCFLLFFQGSSNTQKDSDEEVSNWRKNVPVPQWLKPSPDTSTAKKGSKAVSVNRPLRVPTQDDGVRDSQFVFFGDEKMPTTKMGIHVPGWTVFENLYLFNGTIYVVTDEPKKIPDRMLLISSGAWLFNEPEDVARRTPSDADLQVISPEEAKELFGLYAAWLDGTSFVTSDPPQFIAHYYHWCAEVLFGLWRAYSLLDLKIDAEGNTELPSPKRLMMSHTPYDKFRDYAGMTQWVTRGIFPALSMEFEQDWKDRGLMRRPFLLERVVLGDRAASTRTPMFTLTQRNNAELFKLPGSPHWWAPVRSNMVQFAGEDPTKQYNNVITYISRQEWGRRKLRQEDHEVLVTALNKLKEQYGYEVNIVSAENLTRDQQIRLAGRTTIMIGVHGNGLTSLLWMKPSPKATVMEFFYPGGFAHDYEWTTRALGMKHYGFWGGKYFTAPDIPPINYPEGFQGNEIPLDGEVVAQLIHERLSMPDA